MQKILLAVEGIKPREKVLQYAAELCRRLRAELRVVELVKPANYRAYLRKMQNSGDHGKRLMENSMVAATFAEAGEHEMAMEVMAQARKNIKELLPEAEGSEISSRLTMMSGPPDQEILRYVKEHRDVVLTIYDKAAQNGARSGVSVEEDGLEEIKQCLSIPLVVVRT
jgi:hypothetical protein